MVLENVKWHQIVAINVKAFKVYTHVLVAKVLMYMKQYLKVEKNVKLKVGQLIQNGCRKVIWLEAWVA
jgi:hypothetical protein